MPPPAAFKVPESEGVKVCVLEEPTMVIPVVRPLKENVEVASVCVAPVCPWPTGPSVVMPPPEAERVVPTSERPLPTVNVFTAEAPLPIKMPESVVEPVPPFPTPSAPVMRFAPMEDVATSLPVLSVARSEEAVTPVNQTEDVAVNWDVEAVEKF